MSHQNPQQKLILIDGNAIVHRGFHALPPFKTPGGILVNAVYGFASILLTLLNNEKPDYIACAFDLKGPTFRHEQYDEYKATRKKAPDELYAQFPIVKDLVRTFQIPIFEKQGYEADDVLGTLAKQADLTEQIYTYIVTGDLDTLQLVSERTRVMALTTKFSQPVVYDAAKVLGRYGLKPTQIPDMKGLQGDSSDNIKGVAGVGAKTTKILLQEYGTVENIYENLDSVKETFRRKLEADRDSAFQSKELATILTEVPEVELNLEHCRSHEYDAERLTNLFEEMGFKSLLRRLHTFHKSSEDKKIEESQEQPSLF